MQCGAELLLDAFERRVVVGFKADHDHRGGVRGTGEAPKWNFHKYLVDRSGARVQSFGTRVEPNDAKLVGAIERLLEEAQ